MPTLITAALHRLNQEAAVNWKRTLYVTFVAEMLALLGFSSVFPFLPLYVKELGTHTGLSIELLAGLVYSLPALVMAIASPIWGALADRYGRKLMLGRAMFGGAVILLLMSFANSAEQLLALRVAQGLITGTIGAANALVASVAPREHTGYAMGLLQVGLGTGLALGPLLGGTVADAVGYYAAFYVTAALLLIAGILVWRGVDEQFVPTKASGERGSLLAGWRRVLAATGVITTYGLRFATQMGRMMILPVAPLFIQTLLIGTNRVNTVTGLVVGVSSATLTVSAVVLGRLGDRTGHRRILTISSALAALFYLAQTFVGTAWQLLLLQAMVGVCMGGIIPAISALLARYTQVGEAGTTYGIDNSVTAAAGAVAPLLGAAVAAQFGLRAAFGASGLVFLAVGGLAGLALPAPHRPRRER